MGRHLLAWTAIVLAAVPLHAQAKSVRFITFNIRYSNNRDGSNLWPMRRHMVAGILRLHKADIFGVQECMGNQVGDLLHLLPKFRVFATGRDGRAGGERCAIFFRHEKFESVRSGTFWLSATPNRPSSSWGNRLRRICTWGEFKDKQTKKNFFVFNTHFDHQSENSRRESAKLIIAKVAELAKGKPALLMGDLNCDDQSIAYQTLASGQAAIGKKRDPALALRDSARVAKNPNFGFAGTWSGFGVSAATATGGRIDFVFTKNDVQVLQHAVLSHNWAGKVASDHRPVLVEALLHHPFKQWNVQMNEGWRFQTDPKKVGLKLGYHGPGHDDSKWPLVWAGECWEVQANAKAAKYDGEAFYRKWVHVPEEWKQADKIHVVTRGVGNAYTLFINGRKCATFGSRSANRLWYSAFLHVPHSALRFGKENLIVFQVRNYSGLGGLTGYPVMLSIADHKTSIYSSLFRHRRLLPLLGFDIKSEEKRQETYKLRVPALRSGFGWMVISIGDGEDNTGDRGLHYRLLDSQNKVVHEGFSKERGVIHFERRVDQNTRWKLVLEDKDTALTGKAPGNQGSVEVLLRHVPGVKAGRAKPPPRKPAHVPEGGVYWNRNWYWFSDEALTYPDAKKLAEKMKGRLLIVSSIEENDFVMEHITGATFLSLERKDKTWVIQGKAPRQFFFWDAKEPNNSRREIEAVIGFVVNGRWHDTLAGEKHHVCVEWGREPK